MSFADEQIQRFLAARGGVLPTRAEAEQQQQQASAASFQVLMNDADAQVERYMAKRSGKAAPAMAAEQSNPKVAKTAKTAKTVATAAIKPCKADGTLTLPQSLERLAGVISGVCAITVKTVVSGNADTPTYKASGVTARGTYECVKAMCPSHPLLGGNGEEHAAVEAACLKAEDLVQAKEGRGPQIRKQELAAVDASIDTAAHLVGGKPTLADYVTWAAVSHVLAQVTYADYQQCHDLIRFLDATQHHKGISPADRRNFVLNPTIQVAHQIQAANA